MNKFVLLLIILWAGLVYANEHNEKKITSLTHLDHEHILVTYAKGEYEIINQTVSSRVQLRQGLGILNCFKPAKSNHVFFLMSDGSIIKTIYKDEKIQIEKILNGVIDESIISSIGLESDSDFFIAIATKSEKVFVVSVTHNKTCRILENDYPINTLSLKGGFIITGDSDRYLKFWNWNTAKCEKSLFVRESIYAMTPFKNNLFICCSEGLHILDIKTRTISNVIPNSSAMKKLLVKDNWLVTIDKKNIQFFNPDNFQKICMLGIPNNENITSLIWFKSGLMIASDEGTITCYEKNSDHKWYIDRIKVYRSKQFTSVKIEEIPNNIHLRKTTERSPEKNELHAKAKTDALSTTNLSLLQKRILMRTEKIMNLKEKMKEISKNYNHLEERISTLIKHTPKKDL